MFKFFKKLLCKWGKHSWKTQHVMRKNKSGFSSHWEIKECKNCNKKEYSVIGKRPDSSQEPFHRTNK